jgi:signal transduction histidine kinase
MEVARPWRTVSFDGLTGPQTCLVVFIALQILQLALIANSHGGIDPMIAICVSASLLTVARLFALQRAAQQSATARPAPAGVLVPVSEISVPADSRTAPELIDVAERSAAWADLMARISHELRTPLNAVIGFSDLMGRELFGPLGHPRYRDYVAHIKDSGEALLKSAEDTLALSSMLAQATPGERPQTTVLASLVADAWLVIAPEAERRGVGLDIAIDASIEAAGDRRAIRQVLRNLLIEAVQRAERNSTVEVRGLADDCVIRLAIAVPSAKPASRIAAPSLPVCIARALLELSGTSLVTIDKPGLGGWQATTVLDRAAQADFFTAAAASCPPAKV